MPDPILCEGLWHVYPNGIEALRGVDFAVKKADYIALIGSNGSGKTTLVKHFNGLLRPTRGRVWVAGLDTLRTPSERLATIVGYTFQNPDHMLFATTIQEEIEFGARNLKLPRDEVELNVREALLVTGLSDHRKESPLFFGKGIRRMITIASVLSMRPEVLVIDEPTTGMDHRGRMAVMGLLDQLWGRGHTVIVITHDMQIVADHCRRTVLMHEGTVLFDGPTPEVFERRDLLSRARLRPPQRVELAQALLIPSAGVPTVEFLSQYVRRQLSGRSNRNKQAEEHAQEG
jgi:energy-coupling factor transport system ATP-binding protein